MRGQAHRQRERDLQRRRETETEGTQLQALILPPTTAHCLIPSSALTEHLHTELSLRGVPGRHVDLDEELPEGFCHRLVGEEEGGDLALLGQHGLHDSGDESSESLLQVQTWPQQLPGYVLKA